MTESNLRRPRTYGTTFIGRASIVSMLLLLCALLAVARESGRSSPASSSVPVRAMAEAPGVRILERLSYGREAPQAQMLNAYLVQRDKAELDHPERRRALGSDGYIEGATADRRTAGPIDRLYAPRHQHLARFVPSVRSVP